VRAHAWDVAAIVAFVALVAFYRRNLVGWLISDDEGSYLYAAWRMSLGERPYRDFLTPQLPVFLLPGGWLMGITGASVHAARLLAVGLTMTAGIATWATARRLFGPAVAAVALVALLLQPDVFAVGRVYRPEPFMLAAQALAVAAFARAVVPRPGREDPPARAWLVISGALFGVATLAKLFGPWPLGGLLLWLAVDGRRRRRPLGSIVGDGLAAVLSAVVVTLAGLAAIGVYSGGIGTMIEATIGHHLRQGASKPLGQVLGEGFGLFALTIRDGGRALALAVALAVAWDAVRRPGRETAIFAWQLASALAFFALARDRYPRHLVYLAPALAVLFAVGVRRVFLAARRLEVDRSADGGLLKAVAVALAVGLALGWYLFDRDYTAAREEDGTVRLADVLAALSGPDDVVLSDYSELNFYARRPTTYAAASLSTGAVSSGQITWRRIADDLQRSGKEPALLALETGSPYSHLSYLSGDDRAAFQAWIEAGWHDVGGIERGPQKYRLHLPRGREPGAVAAFDGGPVLVAGGADRSGVTAGDRFEVRTVWRAAGAMSDPLSVTVRLIDAAGNEPIAPVDVLLKASGTERSTDRWAPDEWTAMRVAVALPQGVPPGTYRLLLGLYRQDEGRPVQLGATADDGRSLGGAVVLGPPIVVSGWRARSDAAAARALGLSPPAARAESRDAASTAAGWTAAGLTLVGVGAMPTGTVQAGTVFPLPLAFRLREAGRPPSIVLTLTDPATGAIAGDSRVTLAADVAVGDVALWPAGLTVRRTFRVPIFANAGAGRYRAYAAWPAGMEDGGVRVEVGEVEVAARDVSGAVFDVDAIRPRLPIVLDARLGDVGTLIAASVPATATAGAGLTVVLGWRARSPSSVPYKVTVQLLNAEGVPVAQHDAEPAEDQRPTTGWLPDEIVVDRHAISLPPDLVAGDYTLAAALYHPLTADRLPRSGGETADVAPGLVRLGIVRIE